MDTSKEYISMCEKATEILKGWEPNIGDYLLRTHTIFGKEIDKQIWNNTSEINIIHYKSSADGGGWFSACNEEGEQRLWKNNYDLEKEISIWLPRQDQLQKMVELESKNINKQKINVKIPLLEMFFNFCLDFMTTMWSFEQLWLAFVMKENYNKKWDSKKEEWELID